MNRACIHVRNYIYILLWWKPKSWNMRRGGFAREYRCSNFSSLTDPRAPAYGARSWHVPTLTFRPSRRCGRFGAPPAQGGKSCNGLPDMPVLGGRRRNTFTVRPGDASTWGNAEQIFTRCVLETPVLGGKRKNIFKDFLPKTIVICL